MATTKKKSASKTPVTKEGAGSGVTTVAATASTAHQMIEAILVMGAFVVIMTMVADTGPNAGRMAVALMVALVILQGITHINPFVSFVANHPLTPGDTTFTTSGTN